MAENLRQHFEHTTTTDTHPLIGHRDFLKQYPKFKAYKKFDYPAATHVAIRQEIARLLSLGETSAEYGPTLGYIELLFDLPWNKKPHRRINLRNAQHTLDSSHFGMDKVKEKIIEIIATLNSGGKSGAIICLDGPPGVGKTSIATSIAQALRRPYFSIPLGGVTDQSTIRGHRRTYSGAMPGAILEGFRRCGVSNPVVILDEGDKAGESTHGSNVQSALLELLDPQQNHAFRDHYLNMPFDISGAFFIITTNDLGRLHPTLRSRLEIIHLDSYTDQEKLVIARDHLVPKQLADCGLTPKQLSFKDEALTLLIDDYVLEAGVRELETLIRDICRKANVRFQKGQAKSLTVTPKNIPEIIGPSRIHKRKIAPTPEIGHVNGMYFSDAGGGLIPIQVSVRPSDKFNLAVTGLAGASITESARYAVQMLQNIGPRYGIDVAKLARADIHVHLLDAASPKDGPSAGVAIATALMSRIKNVTAFNNVAITGEVDLAGNVLPIGGLKEKLEGARKAGVKTAIIPWDNQRHLFDLPNHLKDSLRIVPVRHMDDVFPVALTVELPKSLSPINDDSYQSFELKS